ECLRDLPSEREIILKVVAFVEIGEDSSGVLDGREYHATAAGQDVRGLPDQPFRAARPAASKADDVPAGQIVKDVGGMEGARFIVAGSQERVTETLGEGIAEDGDVVAGHEMRLGALSQYARGFRQLRAHARIGHRKDDPKEQRLD